MGGPAIFDVNLSESTDECLVINDAGPHSRCKTVTNDAESVVQVLIERGLLPPGRRLEYYDSDGQRDQIVIVDGRFAGFCRAADRTLAVEE